MTGVFTIKQGDSLPALRQVLEFNGEPIDVTSADIAVRCANQATGDAFELTGDIEKVDAEAGDVRYKWTTDDTEEMGPGDWLVEWVLTLPEGQMTVPTTTTTLVRVYPKLPG